MLQCSNCAHGNSKCIYVGTWTINSTQLYCLDNRHRVHTTPHHVRTLLCLTSTDVLQYLLCWNVRLEAPSCLLLWWQDLIFSASLYMHPPYSIYTSYFIVFYFCQSNRILVLCEKYGKLNEFLSLFCQWVYLYVWDVYSPPTFHRQFWISITLLTTSIFVILTWIIFYYFAVVVGLTWLR